METGHHRLERRQSNVDESQSLEAAVRSLENATLSDLDASLANDNIDQNAKKGE